jgi:hypothetical protein
MKEAFRYLVNFGVGGHMMQGKHLAGLKCFSRISFNSGEASS